MEDELIKDVKEFKLHTKNALLKIGILSTNNLAQLSATDLKCIYGIGHKSRKSIIAFCMQRGIELSKKSYYLSLKP